MKILFRRTDQVLLKSRKLIRRLWDKNLKEKMNTRKVLVQKAAMRSRLRRKVYLMLMNRCSTEKELNHKWRKESENLQREMKSVIKSVESGVKKERKKKKKKLETTSERDETEGPVQPRIRTSPSFEKE